MPREGRAVFFFVQIQPRPRRPRLPLLGGGYGSRGKRTLSSCEGHPVAATFFYDLCGHIFLLSAPRRPGRRRARRRARRRTGRLRRPRTRGCRAQSGSCPPRWGRCPSCTASTALREKNKSKGCKFSNKRGEFSNKRGELSDKRGELSDKR
eukprot:1175566-Prorocentrum_minimum.AAC.1